MVKSFSKKYSTILFIVLAILAAMALRQIGLHVDAPLEQVIDSLRAGIYIGMFVLWGVSLRRRTVQPQVRRYFTVIPVLMIVWITARLIRYSFTDDPWLSRHLWYLYYLGMQFIPCLAVLVSLSLGKPENFLLSKWTKLLYIPTALFFLLVMTNDFHQLVFVFPEDAAVWTDDYRYGVLYPFVIGWELCCALTALVIMLVKCRVPGSRKVLLLPFVPVILAVVYGLMYIFCMPVLKPLAGDITVVFCLLFAAAFESCIQCGLIQSNTGYDELFLVSRLGAQITDRENELCLKSLNARELTEKQRISAGVQPISLDGSLLIRSKPIGFGNVLWQEDVAELTEAIEEIEENCRELAEHNRIRQKNLETKKKILSLQEKNRVNDLLHREMAGQIDLIDRLLAQYDAETDEQTRRRLLAGAAVAGAYIKRCGNLLLISERSTQTDIRDLSRCFDESFINLELLGVNCLHTLPPGCLLATRDMLRVYRGFETLMEACLFDLSHVWIQMREGESGYLLNMEFVCDTELSSYASIADSFTCEDGAYRFTFRLEKGGEGA